MDPPEVRNHLAALRNVALVCIASILAVTFTVIYTGRTTAEQSCENRRAVVGGVRHLHRRAGLRYGAAGADPSRAQGA